jgi:signal peptidase I
MKRAGVIILLFCFCIVGVLSIWSNLPFVLVFGSGMEPTLKSGSLLTIKQTAADSIREGDIVVYNVPGYIRNSYGYPPVIAHRVTAIIKEGSEIRLQTKADNAVSDPFLIKPQDIRGTVVNTIPYLGFPLLLFRGGAETIIFAIAAILLVIILYSDKIARYIGGLFRIAASPMVEENHRVDILLSHRFEATERTLDDFAGAIQVYAHHLASHTSAIRGLSEASHALKDSATEQNRILGHINSAIIRERSKREVTLAERVVKEVEEKTIQALQARDELEKKLPESALRYQETIPLRVKTASPPGCVVNPKALLVKRH